MSRYRRIAPLLLLAAGLPLAAHAQAPGAPGLAIELEGGPVWQSYNDVEIPNDGTATPFSLEALAGNGPWAAGRLYVTWNLAERHGLRLLLAPFSLTETGVPGEQILFAGESYAAGVPVEATYTFNSYRLSYRYRFHAAERSEAWVGFTAKIRDATVALEQGGTASRKDDFGFVPLLHLSGLLQLAPSWLVSIDGDALAGGPGRAADVALKLGYEPSPRWSLRAGYRTLEGGADVSEAYTFAWLHYAVVSVLWHPRRTAREVRRRRGRGRTPGESRTRTA